MRFITLSKLAMVSWLSALTLLQPRDVAEAFGYEACVRAKRHSGKRKSRSELREPFSPCQPT